MALVIPHDAEENQYAVTEESPGGWFEEGSQVESLLLPLSASDN